jgi:DNA-binding response OmpR family regulator
MRILIAEDNISIRTVLRMSLEAESFAVDEAENGEEAIYLSRINEYDLIIMDIIMPKKSGLQACKEIRNDGNSTPILMLSTKNDVLSKIELLDSGADDYMTKPFSFDELKSRIKALLRRPEKIEDTILIHGDIKLNIQTQEVFVRDEKVYLTRKEFAMLELFLMNTDKVISRSKIMEHVWDTNADPFSNTIESHILNLRKKINDRKKEILRSVPGRGYKITNKNYG